jgi:predicted XRE-type DNA-binding protein
MVKRANPSPDLIEQGSGNVFADLVLPDAGERKTKLRLAYALNQLIEKEELNQTAIAGRLGLTQPKVSALLNYKLHGFSTERLMQFFLALDCDVKIVVGKKPKSRAAMISVVAQSPVR